MTPTERAAVAAAIAALERTKTFMEGRIPMWASDAKLALQVTTALASLRADAAAPADQSDAGRDGVPSPRQEIALHFCTHTWTASERSIDPTIACEPCCKKADTIIRALAPAPSGTPGQVCEHDWRIWPETDGQEQKCMKCGAYRRTPSETVGRGEELSLEGCKSGSDLPDADRDAIREALTNASEVIGEASSGYIPGSGGDERWDKRRDSTLAEIIAALALIGEG